MTAQDEYFTYLRQRSKLGLLYRTHWLYPRIARHLTGRVLDVGCGIGDMVRFRPDTVGVDVNEKTVSFCRSEGLDVRQMEPDRLPLEAATFDGVVLDNVLEHLARPQPLLAEIRRVLRPGGTFVVGVPGLKGYRSDPDHKVFYSSRSLREYVSNAGFQCRTVFHTPFRFPLFDSRLRIYAVYGVFQRA